MAGLALQHTRVGGLLQPLNTSPPYVRTVPDRIGTIGVKALTYGAGLQAADDSPHAVECEFVEDGGAFVAHRPNEAADRPRRVGDACPAICCA